MKLVIHIGMHKTGSTAIQRFLEVNRGIFSSLGVLAPTFKTDGSLGHHGLVFPWMTLPHKYKLPGDPINYWKNLAVHGRGHDIVIVSSEELSRQLPVSASFEDIECWSSDFDEIEVILVCRNQLPFIESVYKEITKRITYIPFNQALNNWLIDSHADGLALHYNDIITKITKKSSKIKTNVLLYESMNEHSKGFIGAFFSSIGINIDDNFDNSDCFVNESSDSLGMHICRLATGNIRPSHLLLEESRNFITDRFGPIMTTLYTQPEEKKVYDSFIKHNLKFVKLKNQVSSDESSFLEKYINTEKIYADAIDNTFVAEFREMAYDISPNDFIFS